MKILYLHQYFHTPAEAGGTRSYAMSRVLLQEGHSVVMVTSNQQPAGWRVKRVEVDGIDVRYIPARYSNGMRSPRRVLAFLFFAMRSTILALQVPADVVFATSTPLTIVIPGILYSRWRRVPLVFEVRDMWPDVPIAMGALPNPILRHLARSLEMLAYRSASRIIALSPGMKEEVVAKGISADKIDVIPNGCDNALFQHVSRVPINEGISPKHIVLFAGTLGAANGVGYLVKVAAAMRTLSEDVGFVVLGDGAHRREIAECAERLGVLGRSFHLLGSVSKLDVARWLERASISVCLFTGPEVLYRNAVQNKFFDSLAAGVPVACNFIGWQSRIALDADIGVYLPPHDPSIGAQALLDKLEDQTWRSNAAVTCRQMATGRFDRRRLGRQLEGLLKEVVIGSRAGGNRFQPMSREGTTQSQSSDGI